MSEELASRCHAGAKLRQRCDPEAGGWRCGARQTPSLDGTGGAPLRLLRTIQYPGPRSTISSVGQSCAKGRDCQMKRPDRDNLIGVARALFYLALVLALLWTLG